VQSMAVLILLSSGILGAQDLPSADPPASAATAGQSSNPGAASNTDEPSWLRAWMRATDKARASQPHYPAPLVTTHVILVQQFRYDMSWQQDPNGGTTTANYGNSRGLEIIPVSRIEVGIFPPPYIVHQTNVPDGYGDFSWQVKLRAFSKPEGEGDYFVGFFLGGTVPTGSVPLGLGHATLSPTFGVGKGFGPWDVQTTVGAVLPLSATSVLGRTIVFNTAVDYRIKQKIWPMIEQNSTFWVDGPLTGNKQTFITPGIIFSPFPVAERLHVGFGGGVQIAATSFHQFNHRWIFSLRLPF
jgi:hypothetical protein